MSSDGPRPGPPHANSPKQTAEESVTPPEEVDPETGTDADGAPVENPSG